MGVGFTLNRIKTDEFAVLTKEPVSGEGLELGINAEFGIAIPEHMVVCILDIEYIYSKATVLKLAMQCEFIIEDESWQKFSETRKGKIIFPKKFLHHLAVITIGTSRGIIHTKTEGKQINQFYLPTINVTELINRDYTFSLD